MAQYEEDMKRHASKCLEKKRKNRFNQLAFLDSRFVSPKDRTLDLLTHGQTVYRVLDKQGFDLPYQIVHALVERLADAEGLVECDIGFRRKGVK